MSILKPCGKNKHIVGWVDERKPSLNDNQKQCLKRKKTSQKNLHESFPRPSRAKYQGNPNIIVGVALGLKHPVTVSIVDMATQKVIAYHSTKQLLGKNYKLLNRYQVHKQRQAHQRHVNQRQSSSVSFGDSNQGKYLNNLTEPPPTKEESTSDSIH